MNYYKDLPIGIETTIQRLKNSRKKVKAGIWQATELFKDQEMLVLNNEFFSFDVSSVVMKKLGADREWCHEHFGERISGVPSNPGESYKIWPYNTFKENDPYKHGKKFSHTYQERFWPRYANGDPTTGWDGNTGIRYGLGDLNDVIKQLKDNPLTRQAYLPIFFPEDTGAVHKQRVPCTLGYYFWIENGILHCNYIIRSCDVLRHFRNDIYLTILLVLHICKETETGLGKINFLCFNLHLFVNDLYALNKKEHSIKNGLWKG